MSTRIKVEVFDPGYPPYIINMGGGDRYLIAKSASGKRWELWDTIALTSPLLLTSWPGVWTNRMALAMSMHYVFNFVYEVAKERSSEDTIAVGGDSQPE